MGLSLSIIDGSNESVLRWTSLFRLQPSPMKVLKGCNTYVYHIISQMFDSYVAFCLKYARCLNARFTTLVLAVNMFSVLSGSLSVAPSLQNQALLISSMVGYVEMSGGTMDDLLSRTMQGLRLQIFVQLPTLGFENMTCSLQIFCGIFWSESCHWCNKQ